MISLRSVIRWSDLDGPLAGGRGLGGPIEGGVEVGGFYDREATHLLLRLGVGSVGHRDLATRVTRRTRVLKGLRLDAALALALLGNLVLIASVILLGLQVRNGARATLASVYQAMNDNMLQINRLDR